MSRAISIDRYCLWVWAICSVVDRHRFETDPDPDPSFRVHAHPDPDPDQDWYQNNFDPHSDLTPSFTHVGKSEFFLLLVTALPLYNVSSFSSVSNVSYVFSIFNSKFTFSGKIQRYQVSICLDLLPIRIRQKDADPTRSGSGSTTLGIWLIYRKRSWIIISSVLNWGGGGGWLWVRIPISS